MDGDGIGVCLRRYGSNQASKTPLMRECFSVRTSDVSQAQSSNFNQDEEIVVGDCGHHTIKERPKHDHHRLVNRTHIYV